MARALLLLAGVFGHPQRQHSGNCYCGGFGNGGNLGGKFTDAWRIHGYEQSLDLCLPPLSLLVLKRDQSRSQLLPAADSDELA